MSMSLPKSTFVPEAAGERRTSASNVAKTSKTAFLFIADKIPRLVSVKVEHGGRPGTASTPRLIGEKSPSVNEQIDGGEPAESATHGVCGAFVGLSRGG